MHEIVHGAFEDVRKNLRYVADIVEDKQNLLRLGSYENIKEDFG